MTSPFFVPDFDEFLMNSPPLAHRESERIVSERLFHSKI